MNRGLDAGTVKPIAAGVDTLRQGRIWFGGKAGRLIGNGVGDEDRFQVCQALAGVGENLADFLGGFGSEFIGSEA